MAGGTAVPRAAWWVRCSAGAKVAKRVESLAVQKADHSADSSAVLKARHWVVRKADRKDERKAVMLAAETVASTAGRRVCRWADRSAAWWAAE